MFKDFLTNVPTEYIENLFKWTADNFNEIPGAKELKRIWWDNQERIKNYWRDAFADEPQEPQLAKPLNDDDKMELIKKYPAFEQEILGNCTLEEVMKKLSEHMNRPVGMFGKETKK